MLTVEYGTQQPVKILLIEWGHQMKMVRPIAFGIEKLRDYVYFAEMFILLSQFQFNVGNW